jgi:uncharacterized protein
LADQIETVRRVYEAFDADDVETVADLVDPEIDWDTSAAPTGVHVRGIQGGIRDIREMLDAWAAYEIEIEDVHEAGDHVVVIVVNRGKGAAGGVPIEARRAHVWRVREGVAVAFRLYLDPDEALAAVGAT